MGTNVGLTAVDVGTLSPAGSSYSCSVASFQVTGGGLDVPVSGTASDFLRFLYTTVSGDFDARVRVTSIVGTPDHLETTAKALLDARDGTANNAAHIGVYITPSTPADNAIGV